MYEDKTKEALMAKKNQDIRAIDSTVDTREGSMLYLSTAGNSAEAAQVYIDMDNTLNETYADTASREYLIRRASERNITPYAASATVVKGLFVPSTLSIDIGTRFSADGYVYAITEYVSDGVYKLQCETAGSIAYIGDLVPVLNVPGLQSCSITEILIPGEDEEETEVFRARYLGSFNSQAFGGNVADYIAKVGSISGVGGVKVYPVWAGGGTVKCTIINSDFNVPTAELIASVQEIIDPVPLAGLGAGTAGIDHTVTIDGVTDLSIDIATTITYESGYDFSAIESSINAAIDAYFLDLKKTWAALKTLGGDSGLIVRISQIESRLLDLNGILDISGTTINTVASNYTLGVAEIPVRGVISG
jgi:uncharacterized phage protein gp47/JayE